MRKNRTVIILDRSGSMASCVLNTVKGFNEQVQQAKKVKDQLEVDVSLVQFNGQVEFTLWGKKPSEIDELKTTDYRPNGSTALRDAVGFTIDRMVDESKNYPEDTSYLVIIISDGEENASTVVDSKTLGERIQSLQDTKKWTFTYMGANYDLSKIAAEMFIPLANIMKYTSDEVGTAASNRVRGGSTTGYYGAVTCGQSLGTSHFYNSSESAILDLTAPAPDLAANPLLDEEAEKLLKKLGEAKKDDTPSKKA